MNILISLLVNLLINYLTNLLEQWLLSHLTYPPSYILSSNKAAFLAKVRWRIWLGFGRMDRASKAYDLAVEKYSNLPKTFIDPDNFTANSVATTVTNGIAQAL